MAPPPQTTDLYRLYPGSGVSNGNDIDTAPKRLGNARSMAAKLHYSAAMGVYTLAATA